MGVTRVLGVRMKRFLIVLLAILLLAPCAASRAGSGCSYDKDALLALDEHAFDQDLANGGGGWRAVANRPGCELAASDLLAAYRAAHPAASATLAWHEGQMRASAGQYARAIPLLVSARKAPDDDMAGWNVYVDATVAFLEGDKEGLLKAREQLSAVRFPSNADMPPIKDGMLEIPAQDGQPAMKIRWPPNIEVVDGLIRCFGEPYAEAYSSTACRTAAP